MNTRKNIELTRKLSWITKYVNRKSPSIIKYLKNFIMDNWKKITSILFTLCSIGIPFSYLHHIDSIYLLQDVLSSVTAWMGAFIILIVIIFFVLVFPLLTISCYFFVLKSKRKYIMHDDILVKLNNLLSLTPIAAIYFIFTAYYVAYSTLQVQNIMLIMLFGPSILCLFYSFKEINTNCRLLLYTIIFLAMLYLIFINLPSGTTNFFSSIFVIIFIVFFFYKNILLLIPECPMEEKTVFEIVKSNIFKSICFIAFCLLFFNFLFLILYFVLVLSILPKDEILSSNFDESVRNIYQLIYAIAVILIYIAINLIHKYFIKNKEKLNYKNYLKQIFPFILLVFVILLSVVSFMPHYPGFIINPMRGLGYIEDQRDAKWYSIDNRFIEWNNFHISFLDKKMLYTQEQICSRKYYLDLIQLTKQKNEKIPFHLYGYMAWNTGNTRVFCPVSVSIGKEVGSKCWHIPSQYINLLPK